MGNLSNFLNKTEKEPQYVFESTTGKSKFDFDF